MQGTHLDKVEEFDHDRCDATEETWPTRSFHHFLQPLDLEKRPALLRHLGSDTRGI